MKKKLLFHGLIKHSAKLGKKYNFSLLAEVGALIFLGISEHHMTTGRWFVLSFVVLVTTIAFVGNE